MCWSRAFRSMLLLGAILFPGVAARAQGNDMAMDNKLSPAEKGEGWILLFDGRTLAGWRAYKNESITGWSVVNGTLSKEKGPGDIVTKQQYANFELKFDWKISAGGSSGVFIRATERYDNIYWGAVAYQLLDNAGHPDGRNPLTAAGSAYDLYPGVADVVNPAGQWNSSRIVAHGKKIEHWMNGVKLFEYDIISPEWLTKVRGSKFRNYSDFGKSLTGFIGIQGSHPGTLALKNIKILPQ